MNSYNFNCKSIQKPDLQPPLITPDILPIYHVVLNISTSGFGPESELQFVRCAFERRFSKLICEMNERNTAAYKIISDTGGNRYRFYCDLSGALACTTKPVAADTPEEALKLAWDSEGRQHFNRCHKCGKWVIDAVYNPEVLECVDCAPFESDPKFCKFCGAKIKNHEKICPICGKLLVYEGRTD